MLMLNVAHSLMMLFIVCSRAGGQQVPVATNSSSNLRQETVDSVEKEERIVMRCLRYCVTMAVVLRCAGVQCTWPTTIYDSSTHRFVKNNLKCKFSHSE